MIRNFKLIVLILVSLFIFEIKVSAECTISDGSQAEEILKYKSSLGIINLNLLEIE